MSPPPLQVLSWPEEFTTDELHLLFKLAKQLDDGLKLEDYIRLVEEQKLQIWRCGQGLILTQTTISGGKRQLEVYGIVGRGILSVLDEACADLKVIAETFQCESIGGQVARPGLQKLYEKLGAAPVFTYYQLEIV